MGRTYRTPPRPRRHRSRGTGIDPSTTDTTWNARLAHREWLDESQAEAESLGDRLAPDDGEPAEPESLDALLDAMEAQAWRAAGRHRLMN